VNGVDGELIEQVRGDDPALLIGGLLPDLLEIEIGEIPGDVLGGPGDLVALLGPGGAERGMIHSRTFLAYGGSIFSEARESIRILRRGGNLRSTVGDVATALDALEAIEQPMVTGRSIDVEA
jgi:hypothetical protein